MNTEILVVDKHPAFRLGIIKLIQEQHPTTKIAEAGCGFEGLFKARQLNPRIVFASLDLNDLPGLTFFDQVSKYVPDCFKIALIQEENRQLESTLSRAQVLEVIAKTSPSHDILRKITGIFEMVSSLHRKQPILEQLEKSLSIHSRLFTQRERGMLLQLISDDSFPGGQQIQPQDREAILMDLSRKLGLPHPKILINFTQQRPEFIQAVLGHKTVA